MSRRRVKLDGIPEGTSAIRVAGREVKISWEVIRDGEHEYVVPVPQLGFASRMMDAMDARKEERINDFMGHLKDALKRHGR